MNFNVKSTVVFERQAKRLIRKYPSLNAELKSLIEGLKNEPEKGTSIGHHCFKIRIAIASKGKGKAGGARIITHIVHKNETTFLLSIYDKSELENLTDSDILELIKLIPLA